MKIFVDSSILVEYLKGSQTDILEKLISSEKELYSNPIVFSEFMFYYLAVIGDKSPLSIKESKQIKTTIEKYNPIDLFLYFTTLPIDNETVLSSYKYMQLYNLLPNDALILATIKHNEIDYFATLDYKDFALPCKKEKIKLIKSLSEIE